MKQRSRRQTCTQRYQLCSSRM